MPLTGMDEGRSMLKGSASVSHCKYLFAGILALGTCFCCDFIASNGRCCGLDFCLSRGFG